jgi:transposase
MSQLDLYVGLDVSMETTAICIIDDKGTPVWRGACATDPAAIAAMIASRAPQARRIGLETGQLSNWLTLSLRRRGLPVVCLDARHAKAALKLQLNKTDANDALGLAQVVRTGWYREVAVKSMERGASRLKFDGLRRVEHRAMAFQRWPWPASRTAFHIAKRVQAFRRSGGDQYNWEARWVRIR